MRTLADQRFPAGEHELRWDSADNRGNRVSSGVYFYKFISGDIVQTRKMVIVK